MRTRIIDTNLMILGRKMNQKNRLIFFKYTIDNKIFYFVNP